MRLGIRHVTRFRYDDPAWESHNVLRACPVSDEAQRLLEYRVEVSPSTRIVTHDDVWGTRVDEFGIREPHRELQIVARSLVDTAPRRPQPAQDGDATPVWALRDQSFRDRSWVFLQPSMHTHWGEPLAAVARAAGGEARTVVEVARNVVAEVHRTLAYLPGSTDVGVDVNEVLAGGVGVCQDFVHLGLAMLRSLGVPARYVSGYFYALDDATGGLVDDVSGGHIVESPGPVPHREVQVQTHAWLEVAIPGWGWWALDPTNLVEVGERHVKIGHGRDYEDVQPLRGVYYSASDGHRLSVAVGMARGRHRSAQTFAAGVDESMFADVVIEQEPPALPQQQQQQQ